MRTFRDRPRYIHEGRGARLVDVDGNDVLDLVNASGSVLLGHAHPEVTAAIVEQAQRGLAFGLPSDNAVECAEALRARTSSMETMRFTCSGTEATMYAFRLARAFTGRRRLLFMDGCYPGLHDLGSVGDGPNRGELHRHRAGALPVARGVDARLADEVTFATFNDLDSCRAALDAYPGEFAAIVVEPVLGSAGNIPAEPGFLAGLRQLCDREAILLVFDEMITYSISLHGAQGHYGVRPDLTTTGKAIANGMPIGVFGGRADIMELCASVDGRAIVQHSSSLAAHPVVMAACLATLRACDESLLATLEELGEDVRQGMRSLLEELGIPGRVTGIQHLFGLHLVDRPVRCYADVGERAPRVAAAIAASLLRQGILMSGNRGCVSAATSRADVATFLQGLRIALQEATAEEPAAEPALR